MSAIDELGPERDAVSFATLLERGPVDGLSDKWWTWPNVVEAHRILSRKCLDDMPPYPQGRFEGRGIVICVGGGRYFANGWVAMRILRTLGCTLPIQFWHLEGEIDTRMSALVADYGVQCINAAEVATRFPRRPRILRGWELKPFSMLHCDFQEIMLLDADNVAVVNPEFLFDTREYAATGALFWPDYSRIEATRGIWAATEVSYRDEREVESGQIVLDKARCWAALTLTMHYNEHSDFYYKYIHGDKCTFQLAWARTGTAYAMPERGIHSLEGTMCQHDFNGRRIFQHRNCDKWRLDGSNRHINDFQHEDICRDFLRELAVEWSG